MPERMVERRWESTGLASRALRAVLTPPSWAYRAVVALRNRAYDAGVLASTPLGLPVISVGNLTVGGTGKTPVAAWLATRILRAGGRPAILLRGYGDDEVRVHEFLVPEAVVIAGASRVRSARLARERGATAIVLDDGFQHRRARRDADVVLLSADRHRQVRLLPAGPWREPFESLRRATHVVVTRKRSTPIHARELLAYATRMAPAAEGSIVHLAADALVRWDGAPHTGAADPERASLDTLAGREVVAVSGIGDPRAFEAQLRAVSARATVRVFGDHHAYSRGDAERLARDAERVGLIVCTLKDAVKLGPVWPPWAPPLWYLSQRVSIELGAESLEALARRLARPATS